MNKKFLEKQRQRLLELQDELLDLMVESQKNTMRSHPEGAEANASGVHTGDAGSDTYDRELALQILSSEQDALYEIRDAIGRINAGTYGVCEVSGKPIPLKRLEIIPFARLTVECQQQLEEEKERKTTKRNERFGYSNGEIDENSSRVFLDSQRD